MHVKRIDFFFIVFSSPPRFSTPRVPPPSKDLSSLFGGINEKFTPGGKNVGGYGKNYREAAFTSLMISFTVLSFNENDGKRKIVPGI